MFQTCIRPWAFIVVRATFSLPSEKSRNESIKNATVQASSDVVLKGGRHQVSLPKAWLLVTSDPWTELQVSGSLAWCLHAGFLEKL